MRIWCYIDKSSDIESYSKMLWDLDTFIYKIWQKFHCPLLEHFDTRNLIKSNGITFVMEYSSRRKDGPEAQQQKVILFLFLDICWFSTTLHFLLNCDVTVISGGTSCLKSEKLRCNSIFPFSMLSPCCSMFPCWVVFAVLPLHPCLLETLNISSVKVFAMQTCRRRCD